MYKIINKTKYSEELVADNLTYDQVMDRLNCDIPRRADLIITIDDLPLSKATPITLTNHAYNKMICRKNLIKEINSLIRQYEIEKDLYHVINKQYIRLRFCLSRPDEYTYEQGPELFTDEYIVHGIYADVKEEIKLEKTAIKNITRSMKSTKINIKRLSRQLSKLDLK